MEKNEVTTKTININLSDLPAGMNVEKIRKATEAYEKRVLYQETHNKVRRIALQRLSKKFPTEYKQIADQVKKELGIS